MTVSSSTNFSNQVVNFQNPSDEAENEKTQITDLCLEMLVDVGRYLDSEDGAIFSSIMLRAKDAEGNTHPISQDMLEVFARSVFYSAPREYRMTFVRELIQNPQLFCIRPEKQYIACDKNAELRTLKWFAEGIYLPSANNVVVANNWMSRIPLSDVLTRENVDSAFYPTIGEELELDLMHIIVDNGAFTPEKMNVLFDRRFNYFHGNKLGMAKLVSKLIVHYVQNGDLTQLERINQIIEEVPHYYLYAHVQATLLLALNGYHDEALEYLNNCPNSHVSSGNVQYSFEKDPVRQDINFIRQIRDSLNISSQAIANAQEEVVVPHDFLLDISKIILDYRRFDLVQLVADYVVQCNHPKKDYVLFCLVKGYSEFGMYDEAELLIKSMSSSHSIQKAQDEVDIPRDTFNRIG